MICPAMMNTARRAQQECARHSRFPAAINRSDVVKGHRLITGHDGEVGSPLAPFLKRASSDDDQDRERISPAIPRLALRGILAKETLDSRNC